MTIQRRGVAAVLAASVLLVAGCSGQGTTPGTGGTETFADYSELTGAEREDALYEAAQEEGALNIYTSWKYMDALLEGFKAKYPGINVEKYMASSEDVLQKIIQEVKSRRQSVDVLETNQMEMTVASGQDMFVPYESEYRDAVRPEARQDDWTAIRYNAFVVEWNTDRVKPGDEPSSFEELAGPEWAGQLSLEIGDAHWLQGIYRHFSEEGMSDEEFQEIFEGIAANSEKVSGHTQWSDLLGAGKHAVALSQYLQVVENGKQKGAPVAWKTASGEMPEPVLLQANGMGIMAGAPHPAASMLFMDYALGDEGQQIIEEEQIIGSRIPEVDPFEGITTAYIDSEDLIENNQLWIDRYDELLRGNENWWG